MCDFWLTVWMLGDIIKRHKRRLKDWVEVASFISTFYLETVFEQFRGVRHRLCKEERKRRRKRKPPEGFGLGIQLRAV